MQVRRIQTRMEGGKAMNWIPQRSFWLHPADPEYDPDYDADEDYDRYQEALEDRGDYEREMGR